MKGWGSKHGGYADVPAGVVGWVSGGEPAEGCKSIDVMIFAATAAEVRQRTRELGLWHPRVMSGFGKLDREGVAAAVADPGGFVWNWSEGGPWRSSASWPPA